MLDRSSKSKCIAANAEISERRTKSRKNINFTELKKRRKKVPRFCSQLSSRIRAQNEKVSVENVLEEAPRGVRDVVGESLADEVVRDVPVVQQVDAAKVSDSDQKAALLPKIKNVFEILAKSPDELVVIDDFLPTEAAEKYLKVVESAPQESWHVATNHEHDGGAAIHHYLVGDGSTGSEYNDGVEELLSLVGSSAFPGADVDMVRLQLGRYESGDQIAPHDDVAVQELEMPPGSKRQAVVASRRIACIYYLTKDWTAEMGGAFVDLHGRKETEYVPKFNRLVAFNVPRLHAVEPVADAASRPRYSVFGWLYEPYQRTNKKGRSRY